MSSVWLAVASVFVIAVTEDDRLVTMGGFCKAVALRLSIVKFPKVVPIAPLTPPGDEGDPVTSITVVGAPPSSASVTVRSARADDAKPSIMIPASARVPGSNLESRNSLMVVCPEKRTFKHVDVVGRRSSCRCGRGNLTSLRLRWDGSSFHVLPRLAIGKVDQGALASQLNLSSTGNWLSDSAHAKTRSSQVNFHVSRSSKGGWYNLKTPDRVTLQLSSRSWVERAS